jgi:RimJ/RimL family protein N-acetyltransferase
LGFVEEGRLRADAWRDGEWVDRIVLSILADDWDGAAR